MIRWTLPTNFHRLNSFINYHFHGLCTLKLDFVKYTPRNGCTSKKVHDFTFLLASFCFVKFTKNEFSGNDSNSIELTAVVLKIDQLNSNWLDWKNPRTYTERKIPWISLFRIILYSYIIRFYRSWHWNKRVCWKQWFSFLGTTTISLLHYKLLRLIT